MMEIKKINSHAVGRDLWILFSLIYFLENMKRKKVSKCHQRQPQVFSFNF